MPLIEAIDQDLKKAMKASEKKAVSALRLIKSALKYREIEKGGRLEDQDETSVLSSLLKQRKESIEQYEKAGREDLAASERAEIEVIMRYLPDQIPEAELEGIVRAVISDLGASGPKDVGRVMKEVMPRVRGRADGKVVNVIVSRLLSA